MQETTRMQHPLKADIECARLEHLRHVSSIDSDSLLDDFGLLPSGSKFKVSRLQKGPPPANALIFCHGYRPAGIPLAAPFCANDNPHRAVYLSLMKENQFLVASVSYRREGVIYADAVEDVMEMRALLIEKYKVAGHFLVQGRSMGGAVATLLNERHGDKFAGILTLGAALHVSPEPTDGKKPIFSGKPKTRQIFLTNVSEIAVVESYVEKCQGPYMPIIHTLNREDQKRKKKNACVFDFVKNTSKVLDIVLALTLSWPFRLGNCWNGFAPVIDQPRGMWT